MPFLSSACYPYSSCYPGYYSSAYYGWRYPYYSSACYDRCDPCYTPCAVPVTESHVEYVPRTEVVPRTELVDRVVPESRVVQVPRVETVERKYTVPVTEMENYDV